MAMTLPSEFATVALHIAVVSSSTGNSVAIVHPSYFSSCRKNFTLSFTSTYCLPRIFTVLNL